MQYAAGAPNVLVGSGTGEVDIFLILIRPRPRLGHRCLAVCANIDPGPVLPTQPQGQTAGQKAREVTIDPPLNQIFDERNDVECMHMCQQLKSADT